MRRVSIAILCLLAAIVGCDNRPPSVTFGPMTVTYTKAVKKVEAEQFAKYLAGYWGETPISRSVQLHRSNGLYQFRVPLAKRERDDEIVSNRLTFDAARISRDVFAGAGVEIDICDERFRSQRTISPRADIRYGIVHDNVEIFYPASAPGDRVDAERLARHLAAAPPEAAAKQETISVKLAKRNGTVDVFLVVPAEALSEPRLLSGLRRFRTVIAYQIFSGAPVELHLSNEMFVPGDVMKIQW